MLGSGLFVVLQIIPSLFPHRVSLGGGLEARNLTVHSDTCQPLGVSCKELGAKLEMVGLSRIYSLGVVSVYFNTNPLVIHTHTHTQKTPTYVHVHM